MWPGPVRWPRPEQRVAFGAGSVPAICRLSVLRGTADVLDHLLRFPFDLLPTL